ncbi:hypothetical protein CERSUDRAFT_95853 [Gelatoporia subvermispora B]|uniref:Uncharacterized protein n=1 Tax=Ceriporiopsis subvermispora (strain B) TaxID=914234 RepID=M2RCN8_CERS8|nr:hypothetical protein CERSUDRAFT_95853 [Gelatoporia subvermispora B]
MHAVDPFSQSRGGTLSQFGNAILATAIVKCWPLLLFFTAWATAISVISHNVHNLGIQSTLLTVIGTVLGFVVSYRTTSSFERYNEGRRLWSQIILASRTLARTVWFHIPESLPATPGDKATPEERKARVIIEKKTVINLIEAFAVAVKHYLRGEDGVYYVDLYHLVKYLPSYALPAGIPSASVVNIADLSESPTMRNSESEQFEVVSTEQGETPAATGVSKRSLQLPLPATSPRKTVFADAPLSPRAGDAKKSMDREKGSSIVMSEDGFLLPARMPPKYHFFDLFPFSLLVKTLTKKGKEVKGKTAARMRAKLRSKTVTHNLPLEISLYLSSYIAANQSRKTIDAPTSTALLNALGQLVDALTGLERILTTPIPFSYRVHLWTVTILYCFFLPFQIWPTLKWLTIPATSLLSFIFFGFLVAGEEIENPFGYDMNDLNMDHFTHNIIRNELRALTAVPVPDPSVWAFSTYNDQIFGRTAPDSDDRITPHEWIQKGVASMQAALSVV